MKLPGRVSAAIAILSEIFEKHRPASEALRDWGKANRIAGSADRHAIGTLVYDGLRRRRSAAVQGGSEAARGVALGALRLVWGLGADEIERLCTEQYGPGALSAAEKLALAGSAAMPMDIPTWLEASFAEVFGAASHDEVLALSARAPIDLRVNMLKADRRTVLDALLKFGATEGPLSPWAVRIEAPAHDQKHISVEAEPAHGMGWFEVQDAASQVAALMSAVKPGETVADICAGAGGKTLALAAMMQNKGVLVAHDRDKHRLRPIFERLTRAGATCVKVLGADQSQALVDHGPFDCVLIDAPCSGSGSWRRKPDAKWRFSEKQLEIRLKEQAAVLRAGAALVKPGGRLIYVTCSVLAEENTKQVQAFLAAHQDFGIIPYAEVFRGAVGGDVPRSADGREDGLLLTPRQHGTDGFYVCAMRRG
jgi:16S rRNA (cytosine967-C5)-methyltransferase